MNTMTPNRQKALAAVITASEPVNFEYVSRLIDLPSGVCVKALAWLSTNGYLQGVSKSKGGRKTTFYSATEKAHTEFLQPQYQDVTEGRQVFSTTLNARVEFEPQENMRDVMKLPVYVPPPPPPTRPGAFDHLQIRSRGM